MWSANSTACRVLIPATMLCTNAPTNASPAPVESFASTPACQSVSARLRGQQTDRRDGNFLGLLKDKTPVLPAGHDNNRTQPSKVPGCNKLVVAAAELLALRLVDDQQVDGGEDRGVEGLGGRCRVPHGETAAPLSCRQRCDGRLERNFVLADNGSVGGEEGVRERIELRVRAPRRRPGEEGRCLPRGKSR